MEKGGIINFLNIKIIFFVYIIMPGHYRMKGNKPAPKTKKMTMTRQQTKTAMPKKGSQAMKDKMAKLSSLIGKK